MGDEAQQHKTTEQEGRSKRGILWMLAALVVAGAAVTYRWWRGLPR
jgi:hypothetical protein